MENNSNEKEERYEPQPSLNGQNMDRENPEESYIDDQIPNNEKREESEEEHTDGPSSKLPQRISDVPDGDKDNSEIASENESVNEVSTEDRITAIRPYKGNGQL